MGVGINGVWLQCEITDFTDSPTSQPPAYAGSAVAACGVVGPAVRWSLMLLQLLGTAPPPPPAVPGRVHRVPWPAGADPVRERWNLEHRLLDADDGDGLG